MSAELLKLLMEATVASSLAIVVVLLFRMPIRQLFGARVAYTLWALIPLALIAVFVPAREVVVKTVSQPVLVETAPVVMAVNTPAQTGDFSSDFLMLLWTLGIAACGFWFSRQQKTFVASLGVLNHRVEKIYSAENNVQGPSVIGVLQPRIVLPSDFDERYNPEEQRLVLAHELLHVARGDTRVNLVAAFLRCIFWFNPLLHWADGRFRFDQELSTDANVLSRFPAARKSYADAMLKTQMASIGLPIACHWQAHHPLKERILMLKKSAPRKLFRVLGFGLVAALCLGSAFAAWSTQPANIIVAPAEAGLLYEMSIDSKIDHIDQARIKLREAPRKPFAVSNGEGWSYEFVVAPMKPDYVELKGKVRFGGTLISEPVMMIPVGISSSIAVSTKDDGSMLILNLIVTEVRNGKSSPYANLYDPDEKRMGYHFSQGKNGKSSIISDSDLKASVPRVATDSEIATPAKMLPSDKFLSVALAGKNAGKKVIRVKVLVNAKGSMSGAQFLDKFEDKSQDVIGQAVNFLADEKYQAAIGKDGQPVASMLTVELYDDFKQRTVAADK